MYELGWRFVVFCGLEGFILFVSWVVCVFCFLRFFSFCRVFCFFLHCGCLWVDRFWCCCCSCVVSFGVLAWVFCLRIVLSYYLYTILVWCGDVVCRDVLAPVFECLFYARVLWLVGVLLDIVGLCWVGVCVCVVARL